MKDAADLVESINPQKACDAPAADSKPISIKPEVSNTIVYIFFMKKKFSDKKLFLKYLFTII